VSNFQEFKREKVLIIVEDGFVSSILSTDNIEVVLIDKDEPEFTDFFEADALDETVDHDTLNVVIDELINEFHEDIRSRDPYAEEE
jgi:hypothetical protein